MYVCMYVMYVLGMFASVYVFFLTVQTGQQGVLGCKFEKIVRLRSVH